MCQAALDKRLGPPSGAAVMNCPFPPAVQQSTKTKIKKTEYVVIVVDEAVMMMWRDLAMRRRYFCCFYVSWASLVGEQLLLFSCDSTHYERLPIAIGDMSSRCNQIAHGQIVYMKREDEELQNMKKMW